MSSEAEREIKTPVRYEHEHAFDLLLIIDADNRVFARVPARYKSDAAAIVAALNERASLEAANAKLVEERDAALACLRRCGVAASDLLENHGGITEQAQHAVHNPLEADKLVNDRIAELECSVAQQSDTIAATWTALGLQTTDQANGMTLPEFAEVLREEIIDLKTALRCGLGQDKAREGDVEFALERCPAWKRLEAENERLREACEAAKNQIEDVIEGLSISTIAKSILAGTKKQLSNALAAER